MNQRVAATGAPYLMSSMSVFLADNCLAAAVLKWAEGNAEMDRLPAEVREATGRVVCCC